MKTEKASITIKGEGGEKTFPYDKKVAETLAEAQELVAAFFDKVREGKTTALSAVLDSFNYGYDLKVKASVRQRAVATLEGPSKAFENARKNLVAALMASGLAEDAAGVIVDAQLASMKANIAQPTA